MARALSGVRLPQVIYSVTAQEKDVQPPLAARRSPVAAAFVPCTAELQVVGWLVVGVYGAGDAPGYLAQLPGLGLGQRVED